MSNEVALTREEIVMPNLFALVDKLGDEYQALVDEGKGTSVEAMHIYRLRGAVYNSMHYPLQVISVSGTSWLDWIIRILTGFSRTSHVAYCRGELKIEAWAGENKVRIVVGIKTGYENNKSYLYDVADKVTKNDQDLIWNWAIGEEGAYYDWLAALGIALKRNWNNKKAYICSEFIYQGFKNLGIVDSNSELVDASKATPKLIENVDYLKFNREV